MAQTVKDLPAKQETQVHFLGQEDPLEKEMATHSSILTWRISWIEEPGYGPWSQRAGHDWVANTLSLPNTSYKWRGFPCDSADKETAYNAEDLDSIPVGEDPLEKKAATHSSTLAWKIPWTEERDRLQSMELQLVGHNCVTNFHFFTNGSLLQKVFTFWWSDGKYYA